MPHRMVLAELIARRVPDRRVARGAIHRFPAVARSGGGERVSERESGQGAQRGTRWAPSFGLHRVRGSGVTISDELALQD